MTTEGLKDSARVFLGSERVNELSRYVEGDPLIDVALIIYAAHREALSMSTHTYVSFRAFERFSGLVARPLDVTEKTRVGSREIISRGRGEEEAHPRRNLCTRAPYQRRYRG